MAAVFPFGKPAGPEDIVDREEFIAELVERLSDGHSVILAGPRRIGKSSVAGEVLRRLRERGAYTAQLDLFHVTSTEEFGVKLLRAVLENRTGPYHHAVRALRGLREWLSRAELKAKVHDLELGLTFSTGSPDPEEVLETAVNTAEQLATRDGRQMVVLLDEFQEVDRIGGEPLLKRLRALFQQQSRVAYLFLGSQTTLLRTIFGDRRQAFYRFATLLQLPPVPEHAWEEYIRRRLADHDLTISGPALDTLLSKTGGHPYCVMAVAYNAYLSAKLEGVREITSDMVHFAYEQTMDHLDEFYTVQWAEIRRIQHADAVLRAVVEGGQPYALPLYPSAVSKALRYLMRISILHKGTQRGQYELVEPMFGDWVRRHT
ncbi:AAA family ATPase [Caldinitratiruptor microaerophilus]|uniref:ATPase n=1 Tax=Caldinitratiruptor microaerophilus TaxID=671077 RepID=A0AA35G8L6_9FIRM|nr:ATP-binding protein [Caldinitratiruptor microaerophilus]BDG59389.1 ATPase [Caldinitratiruptor microaerophilus]